MNLKLLLMLLALILIASASAASLGYSNPRLPKLEAPTVTTTGGGSCSCSANFTNWSLYPAVSNVNMSLFNIIELDTLEVFTINANEITTNTLSISEADIPVLSVENLTFNLEAEQNCNGNNQALQTDSNGLVFCGEVSTCIESTYAMYMVDQGVAPTNAYYTLSGTAVTASDFGLFISEPSTILNITYGIRTITPSSANDTTQIQINGVPLINITRVTKGFQTVAVNHEVNVSDVISWYHVGAPGATISDTSLTVLLKKRCD